MADEISLQDCYKQLCKKIASERIDILFPNTEANKRNTFEKALEERLSRMYEDFFDAGHLNDIAFDVVRECSKKAQKCA